MDFLGVCVCMCVVGGILCLPGRVCFGSWRYTHCVVELCQSGIFCTYTHIHTDTNTLVDIHTEHACCVPAVNQQWTLSPGVCRECVCD